MKVAILGGSVFLGKRIARYFSQRGHEVTLVNRGRRPQDKCRQLVADRHDPHALQAVAPQLADTDLLIDTCCYTLRQARLAWEILAPHVGHWVHISSASVYADEARAPYREVMLRNGGSAWGSYGREKAEIDAYYQVQAHRSSRRVSVLIPPYLYGQGNPLERETLLWGRMHAGKPIYMPNEGNTWLHFIEVGEVARIIDQLHKLPTGFLVLNCGSQQGMMRIIDYVALLAGVADLQPEVIMVDTARRKLQAREFFPFRDLDLRLDLSRMQQFLPDFVGASLALTLPAIHDALSPRLLMQMWQGHPLFEFK
ncbi:NAD-dependent epimerase/dehydratase family protein [Paludibacterium sp. B53371]|uniref:NAD-dependent epimerase/dehydratase family protein n=1 Tax=Paludibacterium sp. B53371 TaxID=2806263 RepID=UPI001C056940|nr:NAD-dependent epimerase/dehydratase family protein [Paludibacterium sp. B53371]